jgi:hypothetical protein
VKSLIELAKRHVRDGENRVRRQQAVVDELQRTGHALEVQLARALLDAYQVSLDLSRDDLARYEASHRLRPDC